MADLTITAANVVAGSGARIEYGTAGATVTAGQAVYLDAADNRFKLADCDNASAAVRDAVGIALNGASSGQPVAICRPVSDITIGATLTAGTTYYLSPTPGGICPLADVASGDQVVILGVAKSTSVLTLNIANSGVVLS